MAKILDEAMKDLPSDANITEAVLVSFKENKGLLNILSKYMAYSSYYLGRGLSNSFIYETRNNVINIRA